MRGLLQRGSNYTAALKFKTPKKLSIPIDPLTALSLDMVTLSVVMQPGAGHSLLQRTQLSYHRGGQLGGRVADASGGAFASAWLSLTMSGGSSPSTVATPRGSSGTAAASCAVVLVGATEEIVGPTFSAATALDLPV